MSRIIPRLLVSVLLCCLASGVCEAAGKLWYAADDKNGQSLFFLYDDQKRPRVFTSEWLELTDTLVLEKEQFRFQAPYKTYGVRYTGRLGTSEGKGGWRIPHAQFAIKGDWSARVVFEASDWDPWSFLSVEDRRIDLVGRIVGQFPFEDYAAFCSFWNDALEPAFFALLTHTLYADNLGNYDPALKDSRLKQVFQLCNSSRDLRGRTKELISMIPEAEVALKQKYPWIDFDLPVAAIFSFGDFDYKVLEVGDLRFLLFGMDWSAGVHSDENLRQLVQEGLVHSLHTSKRRLHPRGQSEIVRRSLATFLVLEPLDSGDARAETAKHDLAELQDLKGRLWRDRHMSTAEFFSTYLVDKMRPKTYRLFLEFGRFLSQKAQPQTMFYMKTREIAEVLTTFFQENSESSSKPNP